ncbi:MAG: hypothetical protein WB565_01640 [Acidimicrobiales bacterium]
MATLGPDVLVQVYVAALEDYQFQVTLTSNRTQYCLTLSAGLISVAAALLGLKGSNDSGLVIAVFSVGILISVFSILAMVIGRQYYGPVLDRIQCLEESLQLSANHRIKTTPEQGGAPRIVKISHLLIGLFVGLGLIDVGGIIYILLFR